MKRLIRFKILLILVIGSMSSFAHQSDKMIDIESATALLGASNNTTSEFLKAVNYTIERKTNQFYQYKKDGFSTNNSLTIAFVNGKVDAISWRERWANLPEYTFMLENKLGYHGHQISNTASVSAYNYKNYQKNEMVTIFYRPNDDLNHCTITVGYITAVKRNASTFVNKDFPISEVSNNYLAISKTVIDADGEFTETKVNYKINLSKIASKNSQNQNMVHLIVKNVTANKIIRDVFVSFKNKSFAGMGSSYVFKIMNPANEHSENQLNLNKYKNIQNSDYGKFNYCIVFSTISDKGDREGSTSFFCNAVR